MIFVKESANWAPEWTHLRLTPSPISSFMARACNMYSWQFGGAARVTRSYRLLQSVTANEDGRFWARNVAEANDSGSSERACSGFRQLQDGCNIQPQHNLNHDNWSSVEDIAIVSAARVETTTRWIFLDPHDNGLMGHLQFCPISLWVDRIMLPACASGFFGDEKDASEKARNLRSEHGIDFIVMVKSWSFLASWRTLFPSIKSETFALDMADCRKLSLLAKSGRVFTEAYCREPTKARSACRSLSSTSIWSSLRLSAEMVIGMMFLTYADWDNEMLLSACCWSSIPVKVNCPVLRLPNGKVASNSLIFSSKRLFPPPRPSSTWVPKIPSGSPVLGSLKM